VVRLAQPPGIRSCHDGGVWEHCRERSSGRNHWMIELENLLRECVEVDRLLLKHELHHLMRSAAAGTLKFGAAAEGGQVDQMSVAPLILEIRLSTRPGDEGVEQIVRLYFTEPDHAPRCLLAAKVAGKRPGPLGLVEQSAHAREAEARVHRFFTNSP